MTKGSDIELDGIAVSVIFSNFCCDEQACLLKICLLISYLFPSMKVTSLLSPGKYDKSSENDDVTTKKIFDVKILQKIKNMSVKAADCCIYAQN